jgi:N-acetylglucosamine kinase-like BadF-type ATPase
LRIAITDENLMLIAEYHHPETVNPSIVGHDNAKDIIQNSIREILNQSDLTASDIQAVTIGIAGARVERAHDWLLSIFPEMLPNSHIVPSSDMEIALVGAHGKPYGILLLAGTGSVALGINQKGEKATSGGWGYILGDEGSGYWIGLQAIQAVIRDLEQRGESTQLTELILPALNLPKPSDIIDWMYAKNQNRNREIARLSSLVFELYETDTVCQNILHRASNDLVLLCHSLQKQLNTFDLPIAFAGGLLEEKNPLSQNVWTALELDQLPTRWYTPVIGACLLAKFTYEEKHRAY